jgi:hypothetical protein
VNRLANESLICKYEYDRIQALAFTYVDQ